MNPYDPGKEAFRIGKNQQIQNWWHKCVRFIKSINDFEEQPEEHSRVGSKNDHVLTYDPSVSEHFHALKILGRTITFVRNKFALSGGRSGDVGGDADEHRDRDGNGTFV